MSPLKEDTTSIILTVNILEFDLLIKAMLCFITQSYPTLCDPMDCCPQGSMGILQARILEWVVMPSSRGSSQRRDQTQVSYIASRFFTI